MSKIEVISRAEAREIALQMVFEMGFRFYEDERLEECLSDRLDWDTMQSLGGEMELYTGALDAAQTQYIQAVVRGVNQKKAELDQQIAQYAKGWKLSRLSRMTKAILRLAVYEMQYVEDVPAGAAIDQAVELAKKYDIKEAAAFINGILGTIARQSQEQGKKEEEQEPADV